MEHGYELEVKIFTHVRVKIIIYWSTWWFWSLTLDSCLEVILSWMQLVLKVVCLTYGIHTIFHAGKSAFLIVNELKHPSAKALNRRQLEEWPAPLFVYAFMEWLSDLHGLLFLKVCVSQNRGTNLETHWFKGSEVFFVQFGYSYDFSYEVSSFFPSTFFIAFNHTINVVCAICLVVHMVSAESVRA